MCLDLNFPDFAVRLSLTSHVGNRSILFMTVCWGEGVGVYEGAPSLGRICDIKKNNGQSVKLQLLLCSYRTPNVLQR